MPEAKDVLTLEERKQLDELATKVLSRGGNVTEEGEVTVSWGLWYEGKPYIMCLMPLDNKTHKVASAGA